MGYYDFCYRKNESQYTSTERLKFKLSGLKFVGVHEDDYIDIESGSDHIVVMRSEKAFNSTSCEISSATKPRPMTDAELI